MKKFLVALTLTSLLCMPAFAAPLSSNARTVIPSAIQQILSVDYRALRGSFGSWFRAQCPSKCPAGIIFGGRSSA